MDSTSSVMEIIKILFTIFFEIMKLLFAGAMVYLAAYLVFKNLLKKEDKVEEKKNQT